MTPEKANPSKAGKRGGLGRGLAALMGDADSAYSKELGLDESQIYELPLDKISPNPHQPRKHFSEAALAELAASIQEYGLIQPIIVFRRGEGFIIIAGERRYRASVLLGLPTIKALIAPEERLRELALIENIQREDLNPIELALAYRQLLDLYGLTQEALGRKIHKSASQITNTLRLLNLSPKTQQLIIQGALSQGHAKILVGLAPEDEELVAASITGQKLSVRQSEALVQKIKNKSKATGQTNNTATTIKNELAQAKLDGLARLLRERGFDCIAARGELRVRLGGIEEVDKFATCFLGYNRPHTKGS